MSLVLSRRAMTARMYSFCVLLNRRAASRFASSKSSNSVMLRFSSAKALAPRACW